MINRIENYVINFYDHPIITDMLSYAPWLIPYTKTYPLETALLLICAAILILSLIFNWLFPAPPKQLKSSKESHIRSVHDTSRMSNRLSRKLSQLPHPDMPLYPVNIADDIAGTIVETSKEDSNQASSSPDPAVHSDTDGLSPAARTMLDQLSRDGKLDN
jgi:hypothetical protein